MGELVVALSVLCGVFGLVIGSFLNVVIYRVPLGKSIVHPPSACPSCDHAIRGIDNVPVLSWLLLRGKCRDCAHPIPVRYPLVEAGTGLLFAATAARFGGAVTDAPTAAAVVASVLVLIAFLYLAAISVALVGIDLDVHKLPNVIVLPSYIVAGALLVGATVASGEWDVVLRAVIAAVVLFAAYFAMALAYPGGMGFGDVKLAGVLGLYLGWLGWGSLVVGAFSAFLLGGLFSIILLLTRRATRKSGIPFGPWMVAGAFTGIFFGQPVWTAYLGLVGLA